MIVEVTEALEAAGAPEDKAQVAASVLVESLPAEVDLGALATKTDLDALEARADLMATEAELREVGLRLAAKLEGVKADLLKRVIGAIGFQTLVILGALASFVRMGAR